MDSSWILSSSNTIEDGINDDSEDQSSGPDSEPEPEPEPECIYKTKSVLLQDLWVIVSSTVGCVISGVGVITILSGKSALLQFRNVVMHFYSGQNFSQDRFWVRPRKEKVITCKVVICRSLVRFYIWSLSASGSTRIWISQLRLDGHLLFLSVVSLIIYYFFN